VNSLTWSSSGLVARLVEHLGLVPRVRAELREQAHVPEEHMGMALNQWYRYMAGRIASQFGLSPLMAFLWLKVMKETGLVDPSDLLDRADAWLDYYRDLFDRDRSPGSPSCASPMRSACLSAELFQAQRTGRAPGGAPGAASTWEAGFREGRGHPHFQAYRVLRAYLTRSMGKQGLEEAQRNLFERLRPRLSSNETLSDALRSNDITIVA